MRKVFVPSDRQLLNTETGSLHIDSRAFKICNTGIPDFQGDILSGLVCPKLAAGNRPNFPHLLQEFQNGKLA